MHETFNPDINSSFISSLDFLRNKGNDLTVRGKKVREKTDFNFHITFPERRILTCPYRYNNICATVAETLWVFDGRDDMVFLSTFLPNAKDYSDDGYIWRGAYGPIIRRDNQIRNVIETLKIDEFSRQAIIVISDPVDYDPALITKDRPCTIFIQFMIRDNGLDCYVRMRSNDIIWGCFNINVFEWTFLQEVIANTLNVRLGFYNHNAISFHYYHTMNARIENILNFDKKTGGYNVYEVERIAYHGLKFKEISEFYSAIEIAMNGLEEAIRDDELELNAKKIHAITFTELNNCGFPWFIGYFNLPLAYLLMEKGDYDQAYKILTSTLVFCNVDMIIAGLEYLVRHAKKNRAQIGDLLDDMDDRFSFHDETLKFIIGEWQ